MRREDYRELAMTSLPLILRGVAMAFQLSMKRSILGHKDPLLLAAYSDIAAFENIIFLLVYGSFCVINGGISKKLGEFERDKKEGKAVDETEIGSLYQHGVVLGGVLMLPVLGLCLSVPFVLQAIGRSSYVVEESRMYFVYGMISYFFDMLYRAQTSVMMGLSKPTFCLVADTSEAVLDVAFTYLFVNGGLGILAQGLSGVAMAYVAAAFFTALGSHLYLRCFSPGLAPYQLFQWKGLLKKDETWFSSSVFTMIKAGCSQGGSWAIEYITTMLITFFCGTFGNSPLIGIQVAASYDFFLSFGVSGLAEAASVMVGNRLASHGALARSVGNHAFVANVALATLGLGVVFLNTSWFVGLFLEDGNTEGIDRAQIGRFLQIQALIEILSALRNTGLNILPSCPDAEKEMHYAFLMTLGGLCFLNSVLAAVFYAVFHASPEIIFATQLLGYLVVGVETKRQWKKQADKFVSSQSVFALESPRVSTAEEELAGVTLEPV